MTSQRGSVLSKWRHKAAAVAAAGVLAAGIATSASAVPIDEAGYDPEAGINSLGYWLVASDGGVFTHGDAEFYGSLGATKLNSPVIGMVTPQDPASSGFPVNTGYYLYAADGGVFSFGDKDNFPFLGSTGALKLNSPIVDMDLSPTGGYYLTAADGGVFAFKDPRNTETDPELQSAPFYGSLGATKIDTKIVGMTVSDEGGYILAGANGAVWTFGPVGDLKDASSFKGKTKSPVVGIEKGYLAVDPSDEDTDYTDGIYLATADGGVYSFGAQSYGAVAGKRLAAPMVGIDTALNNDGYYLVGADGGVFAFGDTTFYGSQGGTRLNKPIVGISAF